MTTPCASTDPTSALVHLESFASQNLERPEDWSEDRPQGGAKGYGSTRHVLGIRSERCHWSEHNSAGYGREWRVKKDRMEKATGGAWTEFEWSPRPLQFKRVRTERILGNIRG